jgi:hypothetical protein
MIYVAQTRALLMPLNKAKDRSWPRLFYLRLVPAGPRLCTGQDLRGSHRPSRPAPPCTPAKANWHPLTTFSNFYFNPIIQNLRAPVATRRPFLLTDTYPHTLATKPPHARVTPRPAFADERPSLVVRKHANSREASQKPKRSPTTLKPGINFLPMPSPVRNTEAAAFPNEG